MENGKEIKLFEDKKIRTHWDAEQEKWYFSVVDVCNVLAESVSKDPSAYWRKLKQRLKVEGSQVVTDCHGLKMRASDGKYYKTDVMDMEGVLRLIQSIPSPKAEPFKIWLARVGSERLDEITDPELAIDRALATYLAKGYSREWINQRLQAIQVRKELTDEWKDRGIQEGKEFAILTNVITEAWSGMTTREYKDLKGLKKENLRDNMTTTEIILNMLAEVSTRDISKEERPDGLRESIDVAQRGGNVARIARTALEQETGKTVISADNAKGLKKLR